MIKRNKKDNMKNLFKNNLLLIKNEVVKGQYFGYNVDTDTILMFQCEEFVPGGKINGLPIKP